MLEIKRILEDGPFIQCEEAIGESIPWKPSTPIETSSDCSDTANSPNFDSVVMKIDTENENLITYSICLALNEDGTFSLGTRADSSTNPNLTVTTATDNDGSYPHGFNPWPW